MSECWDSSIKDELQMVEEEVRRSIRSEQPILTEICEYVISSGGKRMRPGVTLLSYLANGGRETDDVVKIAAAFEMIHSATLIHDDINDRSEMRRGRPSAYKKFGLQQALVGGDFLFVKAFAIGGFFDEEIVGLVADACTAIAESEIVQFEKEGQIAPLDVYLRIIEGKTARPIMAGARIGAYLAKAGPDRIHAMGEYGLNIGMAFQIVDDILDIIGKQGSLGKPLMVDFHEGKATLPLIQAMEDPKVGPRLSKLFRKKRKTNADIEEASALIAMTDTVERAKQRAKGYAERALAALEGLQDSGHKQGLIRLATMVVERDY
ncbi:MAG TPA: polyprenyl synthetase family protein [Methanomassiliicoccales archaeon]|nr:polyprenyl synthetase family protein [Methanomassiliicoccales archaeon]